MATAKLEKNNANIKVASLAKNKLKNGQTSIFQKIKI